MSAHRAALERQEEGTLSAIHSPHAAGAQEGQTQPEIIRPVPIPAPMPLPSAGAVAARDVDLEMMPSPRGAEGEGTPRFELQLPTVRVSYGQNVEPSGSPAALSPARERAHRALERARVAKSFSDDPQMEI